MTDTSPSSRVATIRGTAASASTIVLIYAAFAALWVLLSDLAVEWLFSDPAVIVVVSTLKGWVFVAVTSLLLYGLIKRKAGNSHLEVRRGLRLGLPFLLLAIAIAVLSGIGIVQSLIHDRDKEIARLQTIADLKTQQVADWLKERQGDAEFVQSSPFFPDLYRRWHDAGDAESGRRLQARLEYFRHSHGAEGVTLLGPAGERLYGSTGAPQAVPAVIAAAARTADRERRPLRVGPYVDASARVRLDFVAPLTGVAGAAPAVILHFNPADWLFPTLQAWPVPSASGEALLFQRDGDTVLYLNELRHRRNSAATLRVPLADSKLLAAQILNGKARESELLSGHDYRAVPTVGIVRAVPGTDWFLVAKIDQAEMDAEAAWDTRMIALAGVLALFMTAAGAYLVRQHQELAIAAQVQQSQADRLRALQLLDAIAESSTDAIFAKDAQGRYLLFNREAARVTGKPVEDVLGRDDTALFPTVQAAQVMANDRQVMAGDHAVTLLEKLATVDGEVTFLATKGPLRDADGQTYGMFGISRDITDLDKATAALRASEARYRVVLDNAADAVFVVSPAGRYVYVNPPGARMLDYRVDELLSMGISDLTPPQEMELALGAFEQLKAQGHIRVELHLKRRDGGLVPVELNGVLLPDGNIYGSCRDITKRKASEHALRQQTMELRSRNDELERFNRLTVGRELEMIRLKQQVNDLTTRLGNAPPFALDFLAEVAPEDRKS